MIRVIALYLLAVNVWGAVLVAWDKHKALWDQWRTAEKWFWLIAALGGVPGVYLTMRLRRHKTLHRRFMWGLPLLFLGQIAALVALWYALA